MLKIDELIHAFIHTHCDFERDIVLTHHFQADWEADILIINADGLSHEIEIKLSKSDFKNDFKKSYTNTVTGEKFLKHDKISCGDYVCNEFSFLIPMGMVEHSLIPEHCGIIEFYHDVDHWKTEFYFIRSPHRRHEDSYWKLNDKDLFMRKMALHLLQRKMEIKGKQEELIFKNPFDIKKK
ncbi:hypothetical protein D1632_06020 [Chryseobacterium nematophagum]|uniref:Uncharacterized protein n=1 Tax=Chryseobacterium nematophagum TaxID=2305228 RepID=A0A3M7L8Y6_9FLAO|nr:hypothetical protein [Chryseobacterium nematophagum]RMZ59203.1 hypothetical protein D1632_06020 [Chryseobacterium nematophagum]